MPALGQAHIRSCRFSNTQQERGELDATQMARAGRPDRAPFSKQSVAFARGSAGPSIGYVTDQTGNPLRGVKIVAPVRRAVGKAGPPTRMQEGTFHILAPDPGIVQGHRDVAGNEHGRSARTSGSGSTRATEVNIIMEVKTAQETMTIVDRPPVSARRARRSRRPTTCRWSSGHPLHRSRQPVSRHHRHDARHDQSPGARRRTAPDAVHAGRLRDQGAVPVAALSAAFEIQTAGYGADAPTASGGVENLVTRSGTNHFMFEFTAVADGSQTSFFQDRASPRSPSATDQPHLLGADHQGQALVPRQHRDPHHPGIEPARPVADPASTRRRSST